MSNYAALHELGERGRAAERRREPDPYPPPSGPAPSLAQLKRQRDQIIAVARRHGAMSVRVFGSVARSQQQLGSDLDLLVVVAQSDENSVRRAQRAHRCLRGLGIAKDVLVKTRTEFDRFSHVPASLEADILERGRLIYG